MQLEAHDHAFARFCETARPRDLAEVFDATAAELHRVAHHLASSADEADDLVQATFLAAIESRDSWDREGPVLPWLLGILANRARRQRRARAPDPARVRGPRALDGPLEAAATGELDASVDRALDELPEPYGRLLHMHLREGLAAHEIAARVQRPDGSVRKQLSRGLERLRQALPAGLAGAATVSASLRGLAVVRAAVLAAAEAAAPSATVGAGVATSIGTKVVLAFGATCLAVAGAVAWGTSREAAPTPAGSAGTTARAAPRDGTPFEDPAGGSRAERLFVDPTPSRSEPAAVTPGGDLVVTVRAARDRDPVPGYRLRLHRAPEWDGKANRAAGLIGLGPGGPSVGASELFADIDAAAGLGTRSDPFVGGELHADGRYVHPSMPSGSFCVQAFPSDLALLPSELLVVSVGEERPVRVELVVAAATERTLRVVRKDGTPVESTRVEVLQPIAHDPPTLESRAPVWRDHPEHRPDALVVQRGETDSAGELELRGPAGGLAVRLLGPGHAPLVVGDVELTGEGPLVVQVDLGATVEGTVAAFGVLRALLATDTDPEAERWLGTEHHPSVALVEVETGEELPVGSTCRLERDGRFRFDDVPSGRWRVELAYSLAQPESRDREPERGTIAFAELQLGPHDVRRADFDAELLRPAEWTGRLTVDGTPWVGGGSKLWFDAILEDNHEQPDIAVSVPKSGDYRVRLVAANYRVSMTGSAPDGPRRYPIRLSAGEHHAERGRDDVRDFALETAPLHLRVTLPDGTPAANASLELSWSDGGWRSSVEADAAGLVRVPRVPRGVVAVWLPVTVRASRGPSGPAQSSPNRARQPLAYVDLSNGAAAEPVEVRIE